MKKSNSIFSKLFKSDLFTIVTTGFLILFSLCWLIFKDNKDILMWIIFTGAAAVTISYIFTYFRQKRKNKKQ